jgi:hypothetical protein
MYQTIAFRTHVMKALASDTGYLRVIKNWTTVVSIGLLAGTVPRTSYVNSYGLDGAGSIPGRDVFYVYQHTLPGSGAYMGRSSNNGLERIWKETIKA